MEIHKEERLKQFIESNIVQNFIIGLIIINSITIGLETSENIRINFGSALLIADKIILAIFVLEIFLKLYAYRLSYFKNNWNIFDFTIVAIALLPTSGSLAILRSLRIFRTLRLIKNVPRLRFIVESLFHSLPSLAWIFVLLALVFYVFSVIGTNLFGAEFPQWFGNLGITMFSLFQIMTLEGWAEMSRSVMEKFPLSYIYFISFILLASYTTLNIFIAIVVNTMSEIQQKVGAEDVKKIENIIKDENEELREDMLILKDHILKMEEKLFKKN
ncbi:MAG: ion transporter [Ignavibacteria bacterium]|nr:ion transporter [Ignavibacteria bacterium]